MSKEWITPMEWEAEGAAPSDELKKSGFKAGYKPSADLFNYFLHRAYECLRELQGYAENHAATHSENGSDPISPYNIRAIDAMIGTINGTDYTFDTALKQGEYNVQAADAAGTPYSGSLYGKLIVTVSDGKEKTNSNWIWQEFLPASANKQRCWRMKINTGAWTEWYVLYDTGHKPSLSELGAAAENHKHPYAINIGYDRTDIDSGADLNSILDMGCYRCATANKAATLLNCPTKNAFIMDVIASTGGNIAVNANSYTYGTQRIYALGGREYVRQITGNGDGTITYGDWITMYSTLDKPTPTEIGAANTAFSNIPDIPAALNNLHLTSNFKGTVDGKAYTFNTALAQAEYSVAGTDIAGAPYTGTCYGKLVVLVNNGTTHNNTSNWIWQVFYSTTFLRVYIRNKVNDGNWSSWETFYNSGNKPTPADIGAAAASHGNHVPATQTASNKKFLRNDNTWQEVTPANIGAAPSGFGLGDNATDISNKNLITATKGKSGFYRGLGVTNAPNQYWWYFLVAAGSDTTNIIAFGSGGVFRTAQFSNTATSIEWKEFSLSSHTHTANDLGVPTLKTGIAISEANDDLNNYITVGNYCCGQSSVAGTLKNCPTYNAFTMKVYYANGGSYYIGQEIIDYSTGVRHYRLYNASSKTWQSWHSEYSTANKPTPSDIGAADASHNQAASTITAGTFSGQVKANGSGQTPSTSLLRNSNLVSVETNPTTNGEICWQYE